MKCREDPQGGHCNSILDLSGGKHGEYLLCGKDSRALLKLTVLEPLLNMKIFKDSAFFQNKNTNFPRTVYRIFSLLQCKFYTVVMLDHFVFILGDS